MCAMVRSVEECVCTCFCSKWCLCRVPISGVPCCISLLNEYLGHCSVAGGGTMVCILISFVGRWLCAPSSVGALASVDVSGRPCQGRLCRRGRSDPLLWKVPTWNLCAPAVNCFSLFVTFSRIRAVLTESMEYKSVTMNIFFECGRLGDKSTRSSSQM